MEQVNTPRPVEAFWQWTDPLSKEGSAGSEELYHPCAIWPAIDWSNNAGHISVDRFVLMLICNITAGFALRIQLENS